MCSTTGHTGGMDVVGEPSKRTHTGYCSFTDAVGVLIAALVFIGILISNALKSDYDRGSSWLTHNPAHHDQSKDEHGPKLVLTWNTFYEDPYFGCGGTGAGPFRKCLQPYCYLTTNRSLVGKASAVLFHMFKLNDMPRRRGRDQVYVFFTREAPTRNYEFHTDERFHNVSFNLTMTYRRDSDIPVPMGRFYRLPELFANQPYRPTYPLSSRQRSVAWVVRNCVTHSQRERYVTELQSHIDVDVYGPCGSQPCVPDNDTFFMEVIPSQYKFYLAFENSLCRDYVTEKLFRTLQSEVIPIVLGGTDYSRDAPPHSYIDVRDYKSPGDLADYLHWLSENETEYLRYII